MKYATEKQINYLLKLDENLKREELEKKTCREASYLIGCYVNGRIERNKASKNHEKALESVFSQDVTNEYLETKNDYWKEYCKKTTFGVLKFEDNTYLQFKKPIIETSFCFGYGYCGVSSVEDEQRASDMEEYARTNEKYFLDENLEQVDSRIKILKEVLESDYKVICFMKDEQEVSYCDYKKMGDKIVDKAYCHDYTNKIYRVATNKEVKLILKAYQEVRASFEKRLHTYLKKYGLSKLRTWTFLSD